MPQLVLAIDGLSPTALPMMYALAPALREAMQGAAVVPVETEGATDSAAIWHAILGGKTWQETAAFGYSVPQQSLNDLVVCANDSLAGIRCWNVAATNGQEHFRPFDSVVSASVEARTATSNIAKCARSLTDTVCAFLRTSDEDAIACFNSFDLLMHLLGGDVLQARNSPHWICVAQVLDCINEVFAVASELGWTVRLMSAHGSTRCTAMVNLNRILESGGFCKMREPISDERIARRVTSLAMVRGDDALLTRPDNLLLVFDTARTQAASPVAGAIYINSSDRFVDGNVDFADVTTVSRNVASHVQRRFEELNIRIEVVANEGRARGSAAPDIICSGEGIDFNLYGRDEIDRTHLPRSIHDRTGFVLSKSAKTLTQPIAANRVLGILSGDGGAS